MIFTDYSAEQSCTAGRSSFRTGQATFRTGLSEVGGALIGLQKEDPTIAELLKNYGYVTGQFGKNHLVNRLVDTHISRIGGFANMEKHSFVQIRSHRRFGCVGL